MARPPKPLILREAVVEASLRIIDTEGLAAFSLPRLARELNVQAPSLYHHFSDKAEILAAVARAIVLDTRVPDPKSVPNWIEWFVALSLAFREAMLRHRNAMPLILQYPPRDVVLRSYGSGAEFLQELGIPEEQVVVIVEGLDALTLGAGISAAARGGEPGRPFANVDSTVDPRLAKVAKANKRSATGVFADVIRAFLRGAAPQVPETAAPPRVWGRVASGDGKVAQPAS
ncbi:hypothetical protein MCHIJ_51030 [Mycolicibacterium chitae]|uniref:Regulatory protein TetR n=1 Tax=Mycolicibacterium chitae TaxID=1792 RepID=A0A3S4TNU9_MYCCI|nr:TetR family transcriptional regulator [Mycolicibacterium chitae]MCV7105054.1 TetR/AcrR family transcriptional regulator [Mycolicibacterium chitae]BBZ05666.1 hypothetical protein MCHIJ_51030 [Mycolicibacterium chitae]VEG49277.1 regulatory protein TetR [Mycolicibacterium chitae]